MMTRVKLTAKVKGGERRRGATGMCDRLVEDVVTQLGSKHIIITTSLTHSSPSSSPPNGQSITCIQEILGGRQVSMK